ncbi:MAG: VOC family protein [Mycobacteriales bacterium]
MLDHISIQCDDVARSAAFYDAVCAPLGGRRILEYGDVIGFGVDFPSFWLGPLERQATNRPIHLALKAPDRAAVRAFREAAVMCGMEVLHEPKEWPEYHEHYYGAFVRDPDGHNVEAVCHTPE